ncbi:GHKL domain-containing protein [Clostridium sp. D2Q-11]|uniref:GHKL domain-containing protein n=1 Tax=Anaeromonas frigoriresistens TaxID=2683708 RepID=A0A942UZA8_9FIRM|nr:GHKL domain-containing protein [Anaeromonas frigoriresistens]MBS4539056.1 GHKL domain-containing protein [Anaeromonas frigoriresistens]
MKLDIYSILENFILFSVLSLSMIFINLVILKNGLRNEYESRQLQLYDKYIPIIEDLISEVRKKQHEFDNHIQALNMIVYTNDNKEDIVDNLKKYTEDLSYTNRLGALIKLKNKVLAGFIYSKENEAREKEIEFHIKITNYDIDTRLKDFELVEIIGNLVDNAFETEVQDNVVELIISRENNLSIIEIYNKYPHIKQAEIKIFFRKEYSTKSKKSRGYGLYNVKEILDKYNMSVEVRNQHRAEYNSNFLVFKVVFIQ